MQGLAKACKRHPSLIDGYCDVAESVCLFLLLLTILVNQQKEDSGTEE